VVAVLVAVRRLRPRFALGANDAAMRHGGGGGEQALQQKREQRDHADRGARCNRSFACLHHLVKIERFPLAWQYRRPFFPLVGAILSGSVFKLQLASGILRQAREADPPVAAKRRFWRETTEASNGE